MFKSKGFTITFSILAVILIALIVFFCYLVFGKGAEKILTEGHLVATIPETESAVPDVTTTSETETEETIDTDNDLKQQRRNNIKQILYTILAGIIFYFGYKLRATVAIALIAAVIGLYCRGTAAASSCWKG